MRADFGTARAIDARAYGLPGQRTFQLQIVGASEESAALWLEKQQLQALSLALTQVLSQLGRAEGGAEEIGAFPEAPEHDFRVGRMQIFFDSAEGSVVLQVFEITREEEEEEPDIQVKLTEDACVSLNARLQEIIAAGRPQCHLCGQPIDPEGHACIRHNGHSKEPIPEERFDEES
ncbi:MAG TPA: DUF3090 family protein [Dehalococcoidia bacterium]|jgi:uncharacterized repeat protein (TIGR03847 family)|nr:DUF3090 family protein [Dehalococcoidia bacterium]